jgi:REP element-mobilizing transposase RayT
MPNHIHGIVAITPTLPTNRRGARLAPEPIKSPEISESPEISAPSQQQNHRKPKSLSTFIAGFKAAVTKQIKDKCIDQNPHIWQRNYYESIIRDEDQLYNIRQYIVDNPMKWNEDPENTPDRSTLLIELKF